MNKIMNKIMNILSCFLIAIFLSGCNSIPLHIPNQNQNTKPYTIVGPVTGSASGVMLLGVIPIGQNSRLTRAYDKALSSWSGDALINVTISERWTFLIILNKYTTTIRGTAIKYDVESKTPSVKNNTSSVKYDHSTEDPTHCYKNSSTGKWDCH